MIGLDAKKKITLLKNDSHLGVHPGGVLDSLHAGLEEPRLLTDPSLAPPPSPLLVYPASAKGSLEVVIATEVRIHQLMWAMLTDQKG
jgi:hypothetical protein